MRSALTVFATFALALAAAPPAAASEPAAGERPAIAPASESPGAAEARDARWLPWIGCWEPTDLAGDTEGSELLVCFDATTDGVEVLTYGDGEVIGEERIVADGRPVPAADGGCEGTREARWSEDGHRAFILSDLRCAEGVHRVTRGVFALAEDGAEWLEIHGVRSADRDQTMAVRAFSPASRATLERHGITAPGSGQELAIRTSRMAASGAIDRAGLVEATGIVGTEVTAALVAEIGEPYTLDANTLRAHASAGVPDEVIDMMVAVTFPDRFVVQAGEASPAPRSASQARTAYPAVGSVYYGAGYRCRSWDRFCWDPVYRDMLWYYGAPGYGFGGGYGWGFRGPRYVIVSPGVIPTGGRVSPDHGYRPPRSNVVRPTRPAQAAPSQGTPTRTRPAQTRPAGSGTDRTQPTQTRPTRNPPASSGSGGRVNPTTGHSGGSSSGPPARRAGGGGGDGGS